MKLPFALTVCALLCAARAAQADCSYPPRPDHIPDGRTATMAEMVTAQKAVKEYDAAINAYLACIQLEHDDSVKLVAPASTDKKPTAEEKKKIDDLDRVAVQKHNAAIDDDQAVAAQFNEQVRAFKAKDNPDAGKKK